MTYRLITAPVAVKMLVYCSEVERWESSLHETLTAVAFTGWNVTDSGRAEEMNLGGTIINNNF